MTRDEVVREYVKHFNTAVADGDWTPVMAALHPDAVLEFAGRDVGPFRGRDAIAAAYAATPPDDSVRIRAVSARGDTDLVTFAWSHGGTGTMEVQQAGELIVRLVVRFD